MTLERCGNRGCAGLGAEYVTEDYCLCTICAAAFRLGYGEAQALADRRAEDMRRNADEMIAGERRRLREAQDEADGRRYEVDRLTRKIETARRNGLDSDLERYTRELRRL